MSDNLRKLKCVNGNTWKSRQERMTESERERARTRKSRRGRRNESTPRQTKKEKRVAPLWIAVSAPQKLVNAAHWVRLGGCNHSKLMLVFSWQHSNYCYFSHIISVCWDALGCLGPFNHNRRMDEAMRTHGALCRMSSSERMILSWKCLFVARAIHCAFCVCVSLMPLLVCCACSYLLVSIHCAVFSKGTLSTYNKEILRNAKRESIIFLISVSHRLFHFALQFLLFLAISVYRLHGTWLARSHRPASRDHWKWLFSVFSAIVLPLRMRIHCFLSHLEVIIVM